MTHQLINIEDKDKVIKKFTKDGYVHRGDMDIIHKTERGILLEIYFEKL